MVRIALRSDLDTIQQLVMEFLTDTAYNKYCGEVDAERIRKLCWGCLQLGTVWLSEQNHTATGLLIAIKESNIWIPEKHSLKELVWYVKPEYRHTTAAGRLFAEFCRYADAELADHRIEAYFVGVMNTTSKIDLERRGFRLAERLYIKD